MFTSAINTLMQEYGFSQQDTHLALDLKASDASNTAPSYDALSGAFNPVTDDPNVDQTKELPDLPHLSRTNEDTSKAVDEKTPKQLPAFSGTCSPARDGNPDVSRKHAIELGQPPPGLNGFIDDVTVMCEAKAVRLEYAAPSVAIGGWGMETAVGGCRVFILRRQRKSMKGRVQVRTNIATISEDGETQLQQHLDNDLEIIPYTTWGNPTTVILRGPTKLKFYDDPDAKPVKKVETSYTSYVFNDEQASLDFQSAIMDRRLLLSVRTQGTTRIHPGFSGKFSVDEKLCAMEDLRLWRDDTNGRVFAMIHCSPQFRDGYLAFYLNGPYNTVYVSACGPTRVKIKGLDVPTKTRKSLELNDQSLEDLKSLKRRRKKKHTISGVKIDFDTSQDKDAFLEVFRKIKGPFFG